MDFFNTVVTFFQQGGPFMYPIAVVLAIGVAIACERYLFLANQIRINRRDFQQLMPLLKAQRVREVTEATRKSKSAMSNQAVIELDETVILGNQELPKVLYILPWQTPTGLPEIEVRADFTEVEVFRSLYPPAYRRELKYFETLEKISETNSDQEQ